MKRLVVALCLFVSTYAHADAGFWSTSCLDQLIGLERLRDQYTEPRDEAERQFMIYAQSYANQYFVKTMGPVVRSMPVFLESRRSDFSGAVVTVCDHFGEYEPGNCMEVYFRFYRGHSSQPPVAAVERWFRGEGRVHLLCQ